MGRGWSAFLNDCRKSYGCYCKATRMRRTFSWCSFRCYSSQNGGRSSVPETLQVRAALRGDIVKDDFWILCSIYWTKIISISNDSRQDHGYHLQTTWLRWTSSRRGIGVYPSENGRCSQIIENSQIGVSRHLDSSTTTQIAQIMVQYGRRSWSSWAKSVRSSYSRTIVGKAIWENPIEILLGGFQLWMLIRTPWKTVLLVSSTMAKSMVQHWRNSCF